MNQVCSQCLSDNNCPTGKGCFDKICRYPYDNETHNNMITFTSPAQINGNITAPPAYFCTTNSCGTGLNMIDKIPCSQGLTGLIGLCPSTCPYCVNSTCRCTIGQDYEECRTNADCQSGLCKSMTGGNICVPIGGECIYNFDGTGGNNICPMNKPYCVNGTCKEVSLGAICGITGLPSDLCNNPRSLGVTGATGITNDGMGFFCVNGICQQNPGELNDLCTTGSCTYVDDNILVCKQVQTPSIIQHRCSN
jgi:hypothetical protein